MIVEEYRRSLKMPEAEEPLDLLFYRPLAYPFVKAVYRLPITPNQVTLLSLLAGLCSGWCFSRAPHGALSWAATWYLAANVLDCSDGQLARLQHSGHEVVGAIVVSAVAKYSSRGFWSSRGRSRRGPAPGPWPSCRQAARRSSRPPASRTRRAGWPRGRTRSARPASPGGPACRAGPG